MSEITDNAIFTREVQRKLDELINWIVENSPTQTSTLIPRDFSAARQSIYLIATGQVATSNADIKHVEPEPEDGGAQYINDNPAPWP